MIVSRLGGWSLALVLALTPLSFAVSGCCGACDAEKLAKKNPSNTLSNTWVSGSKSFKYRGSVFIYHDGKKAKYYRATVLSETKDGKLTLRLKRENAAAKSLKGKSKKWRFQVVDRDSMKVKKPGSKKYTLWQKVREDPIEIEEAENARQEISGGSTTSSDESESGSGLAMDVKIKTFIDAYKANELKADTKYKNKRIHLLGGYVQQVRKNYENDVEIVVGSTSERWSSSVRVTMLPSQLDRALGLKTGNKISLVATGNGDGRLKSGVLD